eukprot:5574583-Prymnesium_polylepis.1
MRKKWRYRCDSNSHLCSAHALFTHRLSVAQCASLPPIARSVCTTDPPFVKWKPRGVYACFLSHSKMDAASDARYIHDAFRKMLQSPVFLDSSTLRDLRQLIVEGLLKSDVFILLLTRGVLTRPWCLIEIYEAWVHGIPIVPVEISGGGFSFADMHAYVSELPLRMGKEDPAGLAVLQRELGMTPIGHLQAAIVTVLGNARTSNRSTLVWNSSAGDQAMVASLKDIVDRMAEVTERRLMWSNAKKKSIPKSLNRISMSRLSATNLQNLSWRNSLISKGASPTARITGRSTTRSTA